MSAPPYAAAHRRDLNYNFMQNDFAQFSQEDRMPGRGQTNSHRVQSTLVNHLSLMMNKNESSRLRRRSGECVRGLQHAYLLCSIFFGVM
jgi:hypothetical protein